MKADITNALIRCTRDDSLAQNAFECGREGMSIWVRELPECFNDILSDLSDIRPLLQKLRFNSSDYTLHIAATIDHDHIVSLPPELLTLAGDCGFSIELIGSPA